MVSVTRASAGRRRRTHDSYSSKTYISLDDENLDTAPSHPYNRANNPSATELRRVRAEFYGSDINGRRRSNTTEMALHNNQRKDSILRTTAARMSEVAPREGRRKHDPTYRRRREKSKEEVDDGRVYTYKYLDDDPRDVTSKSVPRRRASAPRATSKYESDRMRVIDLDLSRRHTERRAPHQRDWDSSTSRHHLRSSSDAAYTRPSVPR